MTREEHAVYLTNRITRLGRKWIYFVLPFLLVCAAVLLCASTTKPLYSASAKVKVSDTLGIEPADKKIISRALKAAGLPKEDGISVSAHTLNGVMEIIVTSPRPQKIVEFCNAVADAYIEAIREKDKGLRDGLARQQAQSSKEYRANLEKELTEAKAKLEAVERRLEEVQKEYEKEGGLLSGLRQRLTDLEYERSTLLRTYTAAHPDVIRIDSEITAIRERIGGAPYMAGAVKLKLEREQKAYEKTYTLLREKQEELKFKKIEPLSLAEITAEIISYAEKTDTKESLRKINSIISKGIFAGAGTGIFFLFLAAFLDTSLITKEEIALFTDTPVLGVVSSAKEKLLLAYEGRAAFIEPYRLLFAHIESGLGMMRPDGKTILVTSSLQKEGAAGLASNLALVIARSGKNVLLVDADLSSPSIHRLFGITDRQGQHGLTDILAKNLDTASAIRDITDMLLGKIRTEEALKFRGIDRLKIITAGSSVLDSSEIFRMGRFETFLEQLKKDFDYIIFNGPSISSSADSLIISSKVDASFLIYGIGRTPRYRLKDSIEKILAAKGAVKGIILNRCT